MRHYETGTAAGTEDEARGNWDKRQVGMRSILVISHQGDNPEPHLALICTGPTLDLGMFSLHTESPLDPIPELAASGEWSLCTLKAQEAMDENSLNLMHCPSPSMSFDLTSGGQHSNRACHQLVLGFIVIKLADAKAVLHSLNTTAGLPVAPFKLKACEIAG